MRNKLIKNYKLHIGDLAIDTFIKDNVKYISVVSLHNTDIKAVLLFDTLQVVCSNMTEEQLLYTINRVNQNKELL